MKTDDDDDFGIKTGSAFETGGTNTNEFNSDDVLERETVGDAGGAGVETTGRPCSKCGKKKARPVPDAPRAVRREHVVRNLRGTAPNVLPAAPAPNRPVDDATPAPPDAAIPKFCGECGAKHATPGKFCVTCGTPRAA